MKKGLPDFKGAKRFEKINDQGDPTGAAGLAVPADDRFDIQIPHEVKEEQLFDAKGVESGKKRVVVEHGSIRGKRGDAIVKADDGTYRVVPMAEFTNEWRRA